MSQRHPRTVWPNAPRTPGVCIIDQSSWNVVVTAGKVLLRDQPERETVPERAAAIETTSPRLAPAARHILKAGRP
jgi:hypothetical protein